MRNQPLETATLASGVGRAALARVRRVWFGPQGDPCEQICTQITPNRKPPMNSILENPFAFIRNGDSMRRLTSSIRQPFGFLITIFLLPGPWATPGISKSKLHDAVRVPNTSGVWVRRDPVHISNPILSHALATEEKSIHCIRTAWRTTRLTTRCNARPPRFLPWIVLESTKSVPVIVPRWSPAVPNAKPGPPHLKNRFRSGLDLASRPWSYEKSGRK